ncbi:MAG: protocatechuate 3,4-dioxygenase subunit beta [Pseudomonas sp.]
MTEVVPYTREDAGSPPSLFADYRSTGLRSPSQPLVAIPQTLTETTGSTGCWDALMGPARADLTTQHKAPPQGQRIVVSGRVLDEQGRPVPNTVMEIWQANAAGRYLHKRDQHDAPLDPNFSGEGRTVTDAHGRYQFKTIKPGAYPWGNHYNGWRPQHIHFSLFGRAYATRLVTQMYFPGDPLLEFDPIFQCVPDAKARARLVATLDWETTVPEYALGYRFDIVLRGRNATPME